MYIKQAPAATFFSLFCPCLSSIDKEKGGASTWGRCSAIHFSETRYFWFGKTFPVFCCRLQTPGAYTEKTTGRFLQIPFRFDPNRYQNDKKRNLKEFGVLKDTIKGTSSPKNVQTIAFEGIRLKEFGVIFFVCFG
jgi:hypothetical protein